MTRVRTAELPSILDNAISFFCFKGSCNSTDILCKNGRCVNSSSVCNYYNDCGDNSDEFGCRKFVLCIPHRIDATQTKLNYAFLKDEVLSNSCNKLFNDSTYVKTLHTSRLI